MIDERIIGVLFQEPLKLLCGLGGFLGIGINRGKCQANLTHLLGRFVLFEQRMAFADRLIGTVRLGQNLGAQQATVKAVAIAGMLGRMGCLFNGLVELVQSQVSAGKAVLEEDPARSLGSLEALLTNADNLLVLSAAP